MYFIRGKAITLDGREMEVEGRDYEACENKARRKFRVEEVHLDITHRTADIRRGEQRIFYTWDEYEKMMTEYEKKARERRIATKAESTLV